MSHNFLFKNKNKKNKKPTKTFITKIKEKAQEAYFEGLHTLLHAGQNAGHGFFPIGGLTMTGTGVTTGCCITGCCMAGSPFCSLV